MLKYTVQPLLTDTSVIQTPLYYGQFVWSQNAKNHTLPTSIIRTPL